MSITRDRLPLINEGFAFKKAGERITHSEWNAVIDTFAKCYNNLIIDTDETASTILLALADKAEQTHTHDVAAVKGLSEHIAAALKAIDLSAFVTSDTLDTEISVALTSAKASGLFDGADGMDGKDGKDGADYILTDEDKSEIANQVSGDCVSYSEAQALTNEQKRTARENIGVNTTVSITDDGYGNIALNIEGAGMDVTFTDDGNGNIKMEAM